MKDFYLKLPQNRNEFVLFLLIVSIVSVNIIAPIIGMLETGFTIQHYKQVLAVIPEMWLSIIIVVLLASKPASFLKKSIVSEKDSFNTQITINILCNVLIVSAVMTMIGTWIGQQQVFTLPLHTYFNNWPRNFAIAFVVEAVIAQPIARQVLLYHHLKAIKN
ncbi:hypothetical protein [Limosilactobacillus balticus]|uniref:DUF2798 domain-containing protein n=2 Tax=Limosilactobacillus TaxID=2742598 RepID=A0ABS8RCQ2_9LACO|nr:hypothetical protein [Limosilactobacillus balticus]MBB1128216.1 hypothetical protein [Limosilactobacillus balticus]MCD7137866.1 hypothetical protein [Limosilactobacillus balticus]